MKGRPPRAAGDAGHAAKDRRRPLLAAVLVAALLLVAGEVAWFSDPVQDWRAERMGPAELERLVREQPGSSRWRYYYAAELLQAGRSAEALQHATDGTRLEPGSARMHRLAGLAAAAEDRAPAAWGHLTRARELGDRSAETLETLARIAAGAGRWEEALPILEEATRLHPRRAALWALLAKGRAQLLMPEGWTAAAERAAALEPELPDHWITVAEAWLFRAEPEKAAEAAGRALKLDPDNAGAWTARARALGEAARTPEEAARAEEAFRRSVGYPRPDPAETALTWRAYGQFLLEQDRPRDAVPGLERARRGMEFDEGTAFALAQAYRRSGQLDRAEEAERRFEELSTRLRDVRYLQARVSAEPENRELRLQLARELRRLRRHPEAEAQRQQAGRLQRQPSSKAP